MTLANGDPMHSCGEVNAIATTHLAAVETKPADLAKPR